VSSYFVSEASVYRLLKALDLIASPAYIVIKAAAKWLDSQDMDHVRGAPYHPMTQGKACAPT
jgi:hypothetical protein